MGKLGDYGQKPTALVDGDTLLMASGAETYDTLLSQLRTYLNAYFAALNGDASEDFDVNDLDASGTVTATELAVSEAGSGNKLGIASFYAPDQVDGNYVSIYLGRNSSLGGRSVFGFINDVTTPTNARLVIGHTGDNEITQYLNILKGGAVTIGNTLGVAGTVTAAGDFLKDGKYVTRGVASNVNLTTSGTTSVQMNNADDYVFTISAGQTPTLNFNDADFQAGHEINISISGGAGLKITSSGKTIYEIANDGTALVGGAVVKYAGNRTVFTVRVLSATEFELV